MDSSEKTGNSSSKSKTVNSSAINSGAWPPTGLSASQAAALNTRMFDPATALFAHSLLGGYPQMGSLPDPLGIFGQTSLSYGGNQQNHFPMSSAATSSSMSSPSTSSAQTNSLAALGGQGAAWWSLAASQMAAQEYLQRLHFSQLAGMRQGNAQELMAAQEILAAQYASLVGASRSSKSCAPSQNSYLPPFYTNATPDKKGIMTQSVPTSKSSKVVDRGSSSSKSNGLFKLPAETDVIRVSGKVPRRDPPPSALLGFRSSPFEKTLPSKDEDYLKKTESPVRHLIKDEEEATTVLDLKMRKDNGIVPETKSVIEEDSSTPLNLSLKSNDYDSPIPDAKSSQDLETSSFRSTPVKEVEYQPPSPAPSSKRADTPSSTKSGLSQPAYSSTPTSNPLAALDALQQHLFMLQGNNVMSPFSKELSITIHPVAGDQSRQSGKPVDKRVSELSVKPATPQSRASESTDECHDSYGESDGEGDTDDEHGGEEEIEHNNYEEGNHSKKPRKRRRRKMILDEDLLRAPLVMGWKRETVIKGVGRNGIRGDVTYCAPCGRRFKQYPEVIRYLDRQNMTNLSRNNFNFSTKPFIGEFLQLHVTPDGEKIFKLDEKEALSLVNQLRVSQGLKPVTANLTHCDSPSQKLKEFHSRPTIIDAEELARLSEHVRLRERLEREKSLHVTKELKRAEKQQQRIVKLEMTRKERDQKALELKKKKAEALEKLREEEQLRKLQELNRQKELVYAAELEKERRKQHSMLIRSLEIRQKFEEREKRRQKKSEKVIQEWKAIEDLALNGSRPLPKFPRIPSLKLPGKAFGDVLMIFEFLHTFGTTLGFDAESLPSLSTLQRAMTYHADAEDELVSIMTHLLVVAIDDPGIPFPNKNLTPLGQTLKQAEITTTNLTEILRLYLKAFVLPEKDLEQMSIKTQNVYNPFTSKEATSLLEVMGERPFLSLGPIAKAKLIGFLVNELTHNKRVVRQVESQSEVMNVARRERWILDNKIRGYKNLLNKTARLTTMKVDVSNENSNLSIITTKKDEMEQISSDSETEMTENGVEEGVILDEEKNLSGEELRSRIEKLGRQSASILALLSGSEKGLRSLPLGQDRYRRRYWVLPHAGGVYIEGMESNECTEEYSFQGEDRPTIVPATEDGVNDEEMSVSVKDENIKQETMDMAVQEDAEETAEVKPGLDSILYDEMTKNSEVEVLRNLKQDSDVPWFSLLPYVACDDELEIINGLQNEILLEIDFMRNDTSYLKDMLSVPENFATGWWRVTDPKDLKVTFQSLNTNGIREREMQRIMSRYLTFASESCSKGDPKLVSLVREETPSKPHKFNFMKSFEEGFDPDAQTEDDQYNFRVMPSDVNESNIVDENYFSREKALQVDLLILQQVEALEERIASASMQAKSWKLPPRASTEMGYKFRPSFEIEKDENDTTVTAVTIGKERLMLLEEGIEKRYLKPPFGLSKVEQLNALVNASSSEAENIQCGSGYSAHAHSRARNSWRSALTACTTSAQLAMCLYTLEMAVCWDKSIMKACCQLCCSGDNEDQLLLCDSCDRGYHTYCFKPPMDTIPEGDWFCVECVNRATSQKLCVVCRTVDSSGGSDFISCQICPKVFHIGCHIPPLTTKPPKARFACSFCQKNPSGSKRKLSKISLSISEPNNTVSPTPSPAPTPSNPSVLSDLDTVSRSEAEQSVDDDLKQSPQDSKRKKKKLNETTATPKTGAEIRALKKLLTALEKHEDAWPFILPVNTKVIPQYKKIIKNPMDLSTIKKKLKEGLYKSRDEFYSDMILIFTNCETFNEDDSPVGKAGHSLRNFFELRWADMIV